MKFYVNGKIAKTTAEFMPPKMTTVQRDAMATSTGMLIYNTTTNTLNFYDGSKWKVVGENTYGN